MNETEIKESELKSALGTTPDLGLEKEWKALMFGVRRSIRYHLHRQQFFERWGTWTNFFLIISGSTVIGLASQDGAKKNVGMMAVGAIIAILSSIDLVVGFSTKARDYHDLMKAFSELEREMTRADQHPTQQKLAEFTNKRLAIEEDEPPTLRVLDMYCHNELCLAMGYPKSELYNIGKIRTAFMSYFDIDANGVETFAEEANCLAEQKRQMTLSNHTAKPAATNQLT